MTTCHRPLVRHSVETSGVGDDWLDAEYLDFVVVRLIGGTRWRSRFTITTFSNEYWMA